MKSRLTRFMQLTVPLIAGIVLALIPPFDGLSSSAMVYIGVFVCAVSWLVFDVVSDYIVVLLAMAALVLFEVADFKTVFAPFAQGTVWLVIGAFAISVAIIKCGLLKRLAFFVLRFFPKNYRGQIIALFAAGIVTAPLIPSLTAKGAILAPLASSAAQGLGYKKGSKAAAGMFCAAWIVSGIIGCAFLTGAVPVFTILGFLSPTEQLRWSWAAWFFAAVVWLAVVLVFSLGAILFLYSPGKREETYAKGASGESGRTQLEELGPLSREEKRAAALLALALLGWIGGSWFGIDYAIWSLVVVGLMALAGLLTKEDISSKMPWPTIVFIGGIFSLASMITFLGIDAWIAHLLSPVLLPLASNPYVVIAVVCVVTYLIRLVVISQTATLAILFAALGGVGVAMGMDPWVLLFTCYVSSLVWHFSFTNVTFASTLGSTRGMMCSHKDTIAMNVAYMVSNLIGCVASVPLWQMLGML